MTEFFIIKKLTGELPRSGFVQQAMGFRTSAYFSTDQDIMAEFGSQLKGGKGVWQAWFDAIDKKGLRQWCWTHWENELQEFGCAVLYPGCEGETYYRQKANPPTNHQNLSYWYQY